MTSQACMLDRKSIAYAMPSRHASADAMCGPADVDLGPPVPASAARRAYSVQEMPTNTPVRAAGAACSDGAPASASPAAASTSLRKVGGGRTEWPAVQEINTKSSLRHHCQHLDRDRFKTAAASPRVPPSPVLGIHGGRFRCRQPERCGIKQFDIGHESAKLGGQGQRIAAWQQLGLVQIPAL